MDLLLNTIRMVDHDQARELSFGDEKSFKDKLAIGIINPETLKKLNINVKDNIKISSTYGSIVVRVKEDKDLPQNVVIMPVSIWANHITGAIQDKLFNKNLQITVENTNDPVEEYKDLIKKLKGISER